MPLLLSPCRTRGLPRPRGSHLRLVPSSGESSADVAVAVLLVALMAGCCSGGTGAHDDLGGSLYPSLCMARLRGTVTATTTRLGVQLHADLD